VDISRTNSILFHSRWDLEIGPVCVARFRSPPVVLATVSKQSLVGHRKLGRLSLLTWLSNNVSETWDVTLTSTNVSYAIV